MKLEVRSNLREVQENIKKNFRNIDKLIKNIQHIGTISAINKATELTPPEKGGVRGTGTITGNLKGAWNRDSITESVKKDGAYITVLANNELYATFVDEGHRLTKHFTTAIMINPETGLIEKVPTGQKGGMVVGTKTNYIPGKHMKDGAVQEFQKTVNEQFNKLLDNLRGV